MNISDIEKRLEALTKEYDELFEDTLPEFDLDGQMLSDALKKQSVINIRWEIMTKKINRLYDDCDILVSEAYADAISKAFSGEKYREISATEAKEKAKANKAYQTACRTLNHVRSVRDECRGILDVVISRRYVLNNLTNSIIASAEKTIL